MGLRHARGSSAKIVQLLTGASPVTIPEWIARHFVSSPLLVSEVANSMQNIRLILTELTISREKKQWMHLKYFTYNLLKKYDNNNYILFHKTFICFRALRGNKPYR